MKKQIFNKLTLISLLAVAGILSACGETSTSQPTTEQTSSIVDQYGCITIAEAVQIAINAGSAGTTETYFVRGKIEEISNYKYGSMTLSDDTGSIYVYGLYGKDGEFFDTLENAPSVGDTIVIEGKLKDYQGTPEFDKATLHEIIPGEKQEVDVSNYKTVTIAEARNEAIAANLIVEGVVAKTTYANGFIPNGIYVVDNTGSIYIHGSEVAALAKEGNKVKIAGTRAHYILDTEKTLASKLGYQGSIQLEKPILLENDKGNHEFDKTWVSESTIKELMETPLTDNITTNIYKVNAIVKEVPGSGFTNFYFFDIDGKTGSYTYTSCNGNDFTYLREFDNKICTVYLSVINAKSTAAKAIYRFMPIDVKYENYAFDTTKAADYALTYEAMDQFKSYYAVGASQELISSVTNDRLYEGGVDVTYTSSDTSIAEIVTSEGKTVLSAKAAGTATVTVKATYGGVTKTDSVELLFKAPPAVETKTVKNAIDANVGNELIVKAVAGPSLVNQTGVYLIDETGTIACLMADNLLSTIDYGHEIIVKGTRSHKFKDGNADFGQSYFQATEILFNYGEQVEYSKASIEEISFADLLALRDDNSNDHRH